MKITFSCTRHLAIYLRFYVSVDIEKSAGIHYVDC